VLYRLNGDFNPLHGTPEPGKEMGFGGIILHGVYAYNRIMHDLLREYGKSDPANIKEFSARFSGVVRPGDQIQTDIWRIGVVDANGWEELRWTALVVGTGKVCLSDGRAVVRLASSKVAML
jgi:peroxisomal enoyl-CoA hydratase 2